MDENKLIIFDWGGIVECHSDVRYTYKNAWRKIIRTLNSEIQEYQIDENIGKCHIDENGKFIDSVNDENEIKNGLIEYIQNLILTRMKIM